MILTFQSRSVSLHLKDSGNKRNEGRLFTAWLKEPGQSQQNSANTCFLAEKPYNQTPGFYTSTDIGPQQCPDGDYKHQKRWGPPANTLCTSKGVSICGRSEVTVAHRNQRILGSGSIQEPFLQRQSPNSPRAAACPSPCLRRNRGLLWAGSWESR